MNEKISIIVPVYNAENTLDRCVSALIGQTYQSIEIILINDGSKDHSLDICQRYASADSRIKVIDKLNGGVSSARNAGLDAATGVFVVFCDSDDWAEPDWCEVLRSYYEESCLVMCGLYVEGEQNYIPPEIKADNGGSRYTRQDFHRLKLCCFNAPWNKIYLREVIEQQSIRFRENLSNGEDLLFNLEYMNHISGEIIFLDKCVYHYEWPRNYSLSKKVPEDYFMQCCVMTNCVIEECEKLGIEDKYVRHQIYTDRYYEFQKVILGILGKQELPARAAIGRITEVMSSREYQLCAAEANISTNQLYCWIARRKHGLGLWLWHKIRK